MIRGKVFVVDTPFVALRGEGPCGEGDGAGGEGDGHGDGFLGVPFFLEAVEEFGVLGYVCGGHGCWFVTRDGVDDS